MAACALIVVLCFGAIAAGNGVYVYIASDLPAPLLEAEETSLLKFLSTAATSRNTTVSVQADLPRTLPVLSMCARLGVRCEEVNDLTVHDHGLVVFVGERHFASHRAASPRNAITTIDKLWQLRWIFYLDAKAIASWNVPRVTINILTQKRLSSLKRLVETLSKSDYFGHSVDLNFACDSTNDDSMDVVQYATSFTWLHGRKTIRHRISRGSIIYNTIESWYPADDDEYVVFLEDDISVSPHWYHYTMLSLLTSRYSTQPIAPGKLMGIGLHTHKYSELVPRPLLNLSLKFPGNAPYLFQFFSSWGELIFPEFWRELQAYVANRLLSSNDSNFAIPGSSSNSWTASTKRYKIELTYKHGYVMLYPNFQGGLSFSSNNFEIGEHVLFKADGNPMTAPLFLETDDWIGQWSGPHPYNNIETRVLDIFGNATTLWAIEEIGTRYDGDFSCRNGSKGTVDVQGFVRCT